MIPPRRPSCTPPGAPRLPNVPVCRPGFVTPFGGPASGISPGGGSLSPAPSARIPTPSPSCTIASIFSDCFLSCTGTIDGAAPGPVCGWTFIEPFGSFGGEFVFTPGVMSMDTADADDYPNATKPLPNPLATVFGLSGQFSFTEYQTPPNAMTTYQVIINNDGITENLSVSFFGDGGVLIQAGEATLIPTYSGSWTPNGSAHTVHFSVDGSGVPILFLAGISVPLTFVGDALSASGLYPDNSITYGGGSGDAAPASSPLRNLFITAGISAPDTVFCCP